MDRSTALDRLNLATKTMNDGANAWQRRDDYFRGKQDLPFAPEGVNAEYKALREQAPANFLGLAMTAPVQRLRAEGFRTGRDQKADAAAWSKIWQPNKMDARQRLLYVAMMVHDLGIAGVWPNRDNPESPLIRVESGKRVHLEYDPEDPTRVLWAVKRFTVRERIGTTLWTPTPVASTREVGIVYDAITFYRFNRVNGSGVWNYEKDDANPLREVPFVPYSLHNDEDGDRHPAIEPLMPQQDALTTIRFNTLLAMQFSAYRQRVFTGYDPVLRDDQGNPIWRKNPDGTPVLDDNGQPVPIVTSPGRVGVDRALVFPGKDTKVFDLDESNLRNYIEVLDSFLTQLFATGQVPPQYLLNRTANLSGDALTAAESTLQALIKDLQTAAGESHEQVMRLANVARGEDAPDVASEVIWADAEPRSFGQLVDGIGKLITDGFPRRAAWAMLPGATPPKVDEWMAQAQQEAELRARLETDPIGAALLNEAGLGAAGTGVGSGSGA